MKKDEHTRSDGIASEAWAEGLRVLGPRTELGLKWASVLGRRTLRKAFDGVLAWKKDARELWEGKPKEHSRCCHRATPKASWYPDEHQVNKLICHYQTLNALVLLRGLLLRHICGLSLPFFLPNVHLSNHPAVSLISSSNSACCSPPKTPLCLSAIY